MERVEAPARPPASNSPRPQSARRRQAGVTQDHALYSCSCGYVFEAHVTTSVDCPHCGDTQAW